MSHIIIGVGAAGDDGDGDGDGGSGYQAAHCGSPSRTQQIMHDFFNSSQTSGNSDNTEDQEREQQAIGERHDEHDDYDNKNDITTVPLQQQQPLQFNSIVAGVAGSLPPLPLLSTNRFQDQMSSRRQVDLQIPSSDFPSQLLPTYVKTPLSVSHKPHRPITTPLHAYSASGHLLSNPQNNNNPNHSQSFNNSFASAVLMNSGDSSRFLGQPISPDHVVQHGQNMLMHHQQLQSQQQLASQAISPRTDDDHDNFKRFEESIEPTPADYQRMNSTTKNQQIKKLNSHERKLKNSDTLINTTQKQQTAATHQHHDHLPNQHHHHHQLSIETPRSPFNYEDRVISNPAEIPSFTSARTYSITRSILNIEILTGQFAITLLGGFVYFFPDTFSLSEVSSPLSAQLISGILSLIALTSCFTIILYMSLLKKQPAYILPFLLALGLPEYLLLIELQTTTVLRTHSLLIPMFAAYQLLLIYKLSTVYLSINQIRFSIFLCIAFSAFRSITSHQNNASEFTTEPIVIEVGFSLVTYFLLHQMRVYSLSPFNFDSTELYTAIYGCSHEILHKTGVFIGINGIQAALNQDFANSPNSRHKVSSSMLVHGSMSQSVSAKKRSTRLSLSRLLGQQQQQPSYQQSSIMPSPSQQQKQQQQYNVTSDQYTPTRKKQLKQRQHVSDRVKSSKIKRMYKDLLNVIPEGVALINRTNKLIYANKTISKIFNCPKDQIVNILLNLATKQSTTNGNNNDANTSQVSRQFYNRTDQQKQQQQQQTVLKSSYSITNNQSSMTSLAQFDLKPLPPMPMSQQTLTNMPSNMPNKQRRGSEEMILNEENRRGSFLAKPSLFNSKGQQQWSNSNMISAANNNLQNNTNNFTPSVWKKSSKTLPSEAATYERRPERRLSNDSNHCLNDGGARQQQQQQQQQQQNSNNDKKTYDFSEVLSITNYLGNNNSNNYNNNNNNNYNNTNSNNYQRESNYNTHNGITSDSDQYSNQQSNFVRRPQYQQFKETPLLQKEISMRSLFSTLFSNLRSQQTAADSECKTAKTFTKLFDAQTVQNMMNTPINSKKKKDVNRQNSFSQQMKGPQVGGCVQYIDNMVKVEVEHNESTLELSVVICEIMLDGDEREQLALVLVNPLWQEMYAKKMKDMSRYRMKMFASLSHELRTPLNCSISMLQQLRNTIIEEVNQANSKGSSGGDPLQLQQQQVLMGVQNKQQSMRDRIRSRLSKDDPVNTSLVAASTGLSSMMIGGVGESTVSKLNQYVDQYISPALNSNSLLLNLINDILDFVQIDSGKFKFSFIKFNLEELLASCVQMVGIQNQMSNRNVELILKYHENCPKVINSDPNRIRQVVLNFLSNALKFTASGAITLSATFMNEKNAAQALRSQRNKNKDSEGGDDDDEPLDFSIDDSILNNENSVVMIAVEDEGIGISPEDIDKIFTIFNKVDLGENETLNRQGCGLGLTISNSISKGLGPLNKGGIRVKSSVGVGSIFSILVEDREEGLMAHKVQANEEFAKKMATINSMVDSPVSQLSNNINNSISNSKMNNLQSSFVALDLLKLKSITDDNNATNQQARQTRINSHSTNKTTKSSRAKRPKALTKQSKEFQEDVESCCIFEVESDKRGKIQQFDYNRQERVLFMDEIDEDQKKFDIELTSNLIGGAAAGAAGAGICSSPAITPSNIVTSKVDLITELNQDSSCVGERSSVDRQANPQMSKIGTLKKSAQQYLQYKTLSFSQMKNEQRDRDQSDGYISYDSYKSKKSFSNGTSPIGAYLLQKDNGQFDQVCKQYGQNRGVGPITPSKHRQSPKNQYQNNNHEEDDIIDTVCEENNTNNQRNTRQCDSQSLDRAQTITSNYQWNAVNQLQDSVGGFVAKRNNETSSNNNAVVKCTKDCAQLLLVDDNNFNVYALQMQLKSYGFKIDVAQNGQEAIEAVRRRFVNTEQFCCRTHKLIFMDIEMPIKNGYEAAQEIHEFFQEMEYKRPVVVACTAQVSEDDKENALNHGMDDFIKKPVFQEGLDLLFERWYNEIFHDDEEDNPGNCEPHQASVAAASQK